MHARRSQAPALGETRGKRARTHPPVLRPRLLVPGVQVGSVGAATFGEGQFGTAEFAAEAFVGSIEVLIGAGVVVFGLWLMMDGKDRIGRAWRKWRANS